MTTSRFNSPFAAFGLGFLAAAALVSAPRIAVADTATLNVPITLEIPNCSSPQITGTPPNLTVTCGSSSSTAGTCALNLTSTPSPMTSAGGTVGLSATGCTAAVTSYSWTRTGGVNLGASSSASDTVPANAGASSQSYTYTLQWCVGSACASKSATLIVPTSTGTGTPTSTGSLPCTGFNKTLVIDVAWTSTTAASRYVTQQYGGFGANDALVVRFTPPAGSLSYSAGSLSGAEYSGPTTTRTGKISTSPCDFSTATQFTLYNAFSASTFNMPIQVGGNQLAWTMLTVPGTTYYLNIKNTDKKGVATCAAGKYCDMFVDFYKPLGS